MSDKALGVQVARRDGATIAGDFVQVVEGKETNPDSGAGTTNGNDGATTSDNNSDVGSGSGDAVQSSIGNVPTSSTAASSSATSSSSSGDNSENDWVTVSLKSEASVVPVTDKTLAVSYNPMAGKDLNFQNLILSSGSGMGTNSFYTADLTTKDFNDTIFNSLNTSLAVLNLNFFSNQHLNQEMRVGLNWTGEGMQGKTWSSYFAIVGSASQVQGTVSAEVSSANAENTAKETKSTSTSTSTSSSGSNVQLSDKKGGGGLSGGAIAGIVIGVVGGLLLLGAIAFFLLRKRRKSKPADEGFTGTDSANAYMVDKETHARATDSPNSPYSDENQARSLPIDNTPHDEPPVSTAPMGGIPRASTGGSYNSRAETPQGVSTNVAHLVEEGMTVDEIRRLEEEERQLDDEIERAARR